MGSNAPRYITELRDAKHNTFSRFFTRNTSERRDAVDSDISLRYETAVVDADAAFEEHLSAQPEPSTQYLAPYITMKSQSKSFDLEPLPT